MCLDFSMLTLRCTRKFVVESMLPRIVLVFNGLQYWHSACINPLASIEIIRKNFPSSNGEFTFFPQWYLFHHCHWCHYFLYFRTEGWPFYYLRKGETTEFIYDETEACQLIPTFLPPCCSYVARGRQFASLLQPQKSTVRHKSIKIMAHRKT